VTPSEFREYVWCW